MNNKIIVGIIVLVIILGGVLFFVSRSGNNGSLQQGSTSGTQQNSNSTPVPEKNVVMIQNHAFSPASITVKVGDKVTWLNQDLVGHSATADDSSFNTDIIVPGQSKGVTLNKAGTYTYHCSVHPDMKATVIVE